MSGNVFTLRVRNPHRFAFDGVPAGGEGEVPYGREKAERFGLVPLDTPKAPKGKPGPKPKAEDGKAEDGKAEDGAKD